MAIEYDDFEQQEITQKERQRVQYAEGMVHAPNGQRVITQDITDLSFIDCLAKTAKHIAESDGAPIMENDWKDRLVYSLTPLGERVKALCDQFDPSFPRRYAHHVFNPWIKAMLVACCHWGEDQGFCMLIPGGDIAPEDRVAMNRIVNFVRRACRSRAFKREIDNTERAARKNFRSACAYFITRFAIVSRLLISRIDLYYRDKGKDWAYTEDAEHAFECFIRALREGRVVPDVCGWVCRREEGPMRGMHFHILVAMDGHRHRDVFGFTNQIGRYWVEHCTGPDKLGSFFNCYGRRGEYRFNGLGLVHVSDWRKLVGLRAALRYVTKGDYQIKVKRPCEADGRDKNKEKCERNGNVGKNFRRGKKMTLPVVKRGRPREHDLSVVIRILGAANRR